jgi:hypothetical protein
MGLKGEFQTQSGCDFSVYSLSFKNPGIALTFPQDIHSRFLQKIDTMIVVDISIQMKFYINFLIIFFIIRRFLNKVVYLLLSLQFQEGQKNQ